jgi:hypothetical protein
MFESKVYWSNIVQLNIPHVPVRRLKINKEETILTCIFTTSFLDFKDLPDFSFFHHPLDQITHGLEPLGSETKTEKELLGWI